MKISRDDVLRVAELAHLELTDAEVETYLHQLDSILTYIGKLNELDTSRVEPMAGGRPHEIDVGTGGPLLRDDKPQPCDVSQAALRVAPDAGAVPTGRYFRVPKVIDR